MFRTKFALTQAAASGSSTGDWQGTNYGYLAGHGERNQQGDLWSSWIERFPFSADFTNSTDVGDLSFGIPHTASTGGNAFDSNRHFIYYFYQPNNTPYYGVRGNSGLSAPQMLAITPQYNSQKSHHKKIQSHTFASSVSSESAGEISVATGGSTAMFSPTTAYIVHGLDPSTVNYTPNPIGPTLKVYGAMDKHAMTSGTNTTAIPATNFSGEPGYAWSANSPTDGYVYQSPQNSGAPVDNRFSKFSFSSESTNAVNVSSTMIRWPAAESSQSNNPQFGSPNPTYFDEQWLEYRGMRQAMATSTGSEMYVFGGKGFVPRAALGDIYKIPFASDITSAVDTGYNLYESMAFPRNGGRTSVSTTDAYLGGGSNDPSSASSDNSIYAVDIQKFSFASNANATKAGEISNISPSYYNGYQGGFWGSN